MDGGNFEQARYAGMRWNTPLSEEHAARLLERLEIGRRQSLLDLGCGWGELLLRAASAPMSSGMAVGVDIDADLLQRGRAAAAARGVDDRVRFVHARAEEWREPAERVLFGDGIWDRPTTCGPPASPPSWPSASPSTSTSTVACSASPISFLAR